MYLIQSGLRARLEKNPALRTIIAGFAAFGVYSCMYAFRKGFAAGTYADAPFWGMDYKVWFVIAQVIGYMLSKFAGIKMVSELKQGHRAMAVFSLVGASWLALLLFAFVPRPYNILCLFLNGLPLGMIWGIVFSYLEGRRTTEFMGTIMAVSLIFASGLAKTAGKWLMLAQGIPERWMPFGVGLLFALPLVFFVALLEQIPPPDEADIAARAPRLPMNNVQKRRFLLGYFPGIILVIVLYLLLTVVRDMRDNFEVEIWTGLGFGGQPGIFTRTDIPIALGVLFIMSLLTLVRNNLAAFTLIHLLVLAGCLIVGGSTWLYDHHFIGPVAWMTAAGMGLFMAYIPYNSIFFERMIATFRIVGNVGFIMYLADSFGYLGTVTILLVKQAGSLRVSWLSYFHASMIMVSVLGAVATICSLIYFRMRYSRTHLSITPVNHSYV